MGGCRLCSSGPG